MTRMKFTLIFILLFANILVAQEQKKFNTGFCIDVSGFAFTPLYNTQTEPIFGPLLSARRNMRAIQLDFNGMSDKKISPFVRIRVGKRTELDFERFKKQVEAFYPNDYVDLTTLRQARKGILQVLIGAALRPAPRRISAQPYLAGGIQLGSFGDTNGAYLKAHNSHELIEIHFRPEQGGYILPFLEAGGKLLIAITPNIGVHVNASFINFINANTKYVESKTNWITNARQTDLMPTPDFYFGFAGSIGLHLKLLDF